MISKTSSRKYLRRNKLKCLISTNYFREMKKMIGENVEHLHAILSGLAVRLNLRTLESRVYYATGYFNVTNKETQSECAGSQKNTHLSIRNFFIFREGEKKYAKRNKKAGNGLTKAPAGAVQSNQSQ